MTDSIYSNQNLTSKDKMNLFLSYYGDDIDKSNNTDFKNDLVQLINSYKNGYYRIFEKHLPLVKDHISKIYTSQSFRASLYNYLHNLEDAPKCEHCKIKYTKFLTLNDGYRLFCSLKCSTISEHTKKLVTERSLIKHGVEHPLMAKEVISKREATNLEKYGAVNVLSTGTVVFNTRNKTNLEKYGNVTPFGNKDVHAKSKASFIERFGVENPMHVEYIKHTVLATCKLRHGGSGWGSKKINQKIELTNLEKYGSIYPMQNEDIYNKSETSRFKKRDYIFKNGNIVKIMGYENFALDILQEQYQISDIIVQKDLPKILYTFENKIRRYFPDIFIKSENKIIEVKSTYTYNRFLEKNESKREACLKQGFLFEGWVFDNSGLLLYKF